MLSRPLRLIAAIALLSSCRASAPIAPSPVADPVVANGLSRLRDATRPFQNLDAAVAAGYPRDVPNCLVHEHHGAMGFHHMNRAFVDAKVETEHPEILLYERLADGTYRLNGVEYIVPYTVWPRDSTPPVTIGQRMKHEDNLQIWYMHVWAWSNNPDGVFADFNPNVQCPANAKVYKPFTRDGG